MACQNIRRSALQKLALLSATSCPATATTSANPDFDRLYDACPANGQKNGGLQERSAIAAPMVYQMDQSYLRKTSNIILEYPRAGGPACSVQGRSSAHESI